MSTAPAGGSIGPYRIVQTIGVGGWSTVYEVVATGGGRVALKRLRDDLAPDALARFRREVESLRRLDHPGVVALIDAGVDGAAPYLVTPLIEGTSLRAALAGGPLGVEGALAVAIAAAEAVAAIHAAGLVHRDLKPENLMLTPAGDVIVIDLGLALGAEHSRHTAEDTLTGSVPYLAPEQIDDRAPSAASDVWALGVVLYEAIAGRRPFQRARQAEEVAAILSGRCPPLTEIAPGCPEELAAVVASCLAAAPAQRPADGAALAAALSGLVDWTTKEALRGERAWMLADRAGYGAAIRGARVALVVKAAEAALAAGDRFAASRVIDRGLAYAPEDAGLKGLVERLMMAAPAGAAAAGAGVRVTVKGYAPARGTSTSTVGATSTSRVSSPSPNTLTATSTSTSTSTSRSKSTNTRTSRSRWLWIGGGIAAVMIGMGIVAAAPWRHAAVETPDAAPAPVVEAKAPAVETDALPAIIMPPEPQPPPPGDPRSRPAHVVPSRPAAGRTGATP